MVALTLCFTVAAGPLRPAYAASNFLQETFTQDSLTDGEKWVSGGDGADVACLTARNGTTASPAQPIPGCAEVAPDADGLGALQLTDAGGNQRGFALFNHELPTAGGADVRFSLAMYGGTGADGISFFLVDGGTNLTQPGQFGGFLGYGGSPAFGRGPGVDNGLLGVGFDVFGNFVTTEHEDPACGTGEAVRVPNRVGIRGAGDGTSGYCLLDYSDSAVDFSGATRALAERDVRVLVDPSTDPTPQVQVFVEEMDTAVATADLPADFLNATTFKFGFAASTGGSTNIHEIWNLDVDSVNDVAADLSLSVSAAATPVAKNASTTLIYSGGTTTDGWVLPAGDTDFELTHTLPAGATFAGTYTGTGWTCVFSNANRTMTCTKTHGAELEPGDTIAQLQAPVSLSGAAATGADLASDSTLTADGGALTTDGAGPVAVSATADLEVDVTGPATAQPGSTVTYGVTVTNDGPDAAADAQLTLTLSGQAANPAVVSGDCVVTGLTVTCDVGGLAMGGTHDPITITAQPQSVGTATATGSVTDAGTADTDEASDVLNTAVAANNNNNNDDDDDEEVAPPPAAPPVVETPDPDEGQQQEPTAVERVNGRERASTAAALATEFFPTGLPVVYIARDDTFPDMLTGTPLAYRDGAPILLVSPRHLHETTAEALRLLGPERIVILGGPAAVSPEVERQLTDYTPDVTRITGIDRHATAAHISQKLFPDGADLVLVTTGATFADALTAGAAAARADASVLLVNPDEVMEVTAEELVRLAPRRVVVLGGTAAVSDAVLARIQELTGVTPERIHGATRYDTAAAVSAAFFPDGAPAVFVATGEQFSDALLAGLVAARMQSPVLIAPPAAVPDSVIGEIRRLQPDRLYIVGGVGAISADAEAVLRSAVS